MYRPLGVIFAVVMAIATFSAKVKLQNKRNQKLYNTNTKICVKMYMLLHCLQKYKSHYVHVYMY